MTKEIQPSDEQIRTRAYFLWEADGRPQGRDQEYWHRAQKEMSTRQNAAVPQSNGNAKKAPAMITDAKRKTSLKSPTYA